MYDIELKKYFKNNHDNQEVTKKILRILGQTKLEIIQSLKDT